MFREGELHITNTVEPDTFDRYQREEPEVLRNDPFLGSYFYRVNTTHEPFDDPRVRLALGLAVDRDDLVRTVVRTGRTPAYFYTPPNTAGYTCEARQPYDPERARELLAEAGYPNGEGFPRVDILYNTSELHKPIAEALQAMWKTELNIDTGLRNQEWKVYLDSMDRLDYALARSGWIGDYVDPYNFLECYLTGNGNNRTGWSNAEYDELLAKSVAEPDNAKRFEYFQQAEAILLESAPVIPLYFYTNPRLMDTAVENFEGNILGYISYKTLDLEQPGGETAAE
jgi:oligopeptide transport system substrate-binding protein